VGEARRLARTKVQITTPLQRLAADQSLNGKAIALSMSESTDIEQYGLDPLHLEICMLELSRYLLIKGATLAYGGHLGPTGYTQKLFELVRTHNDLESVQPFERLVNHRSWPSPRLSIEKIAELNQVAREVELPRPADLNESLHPDFKERPEFFPAEKSAAHRFAWARGLTEMRAYQSNQARSGIVARVVLGGTFGPTSKVAEDGTTSERWYAGRIPGVLEEVLLSVQAGQPVFLIGAFGGVARLVIDLIQGKDRREATWDYQKGAPFAAEMKELYSKRGLEWLDYPDIISFLRGKGIEGINPLLPAAEHKELFDSVDPKQLVEIVLRGLSRLAKS
jgi:SLOG cluster2